MTADPHFLGARGTALNFNGRLGRAYCLVTDTRLHINALLEGYEEAGAGEKAAGGAAIGAAGACGRRVVRSWIK